jgi:hypothetical protein
VENREDRIEVKYNIARALHQLALNSQALELYENLAALEPSRLTDAQQETRTRAIYNMVMMLKGSGLSTGAVMQEG